MSSVSTVPAPELSPDLVSAVDAVIADAPLTKSHLVRRLQREGILGGDHAEGLTQVDHALTLSHQCCVYEYRGAEVVDCYSRLLSGRIFTHRVTEADLDEQGLGLGGDLDVVGLVIACGALEVPKLRLRFGHNAGWHGLCGGPEWVAGLEVGDVVGLEIGSEGTLRLHVFSPDDLGSGRSEAEHLRQTLQPIVASGYGASASGVTLSALGGEALSGVPSSLFRQPVQPISELLASFGRHRHYFGARGRRWTVRGEQARTVIREAQIPGSLTPCCRDAVDQVLAAWESSAYVYGGDEVDAGPALAALQHEHTAARFVEVVGAEASAAEIGLFARTLDRGRADGGALGWQLETNGVGGPALNPAHGPSVGSPGARLLLGAASEHDGQLGQAEAWYRPLLGGVDQAPFATDRMAWIRYDQSDFGTAVELLAQLRGPDDEAVRYIARLAVLPLNLDRISRCDHAVQQVGVRWCPLCEPQFAPSIRAHVLWGKLLRSLGNDPETVGIAQRIAHHANIIEHAYSRPFFSDLLLFEWGLAYRYLALRGRVLPVAERRMLVDWLSAPLRVYEVCSGEQRLRDAITGDTYPMSEDTFGAQPQTGNIGTCFLGRVLPSAGRAKTAMVPGSLLPLNEPQRQEAIRLVESHPGSSEILAWHLDASPKFSGVAAQAEGRDSETNHGAA